MCIISDRIGIFYKKGAARKGRPYILYNVEYYSTSILFYIVVVVELVAEVVVLLLTVVTVLIATWATLTVLLTVVAARATLIVTSVLAARTARTLLIALGLVEEHAVSRGARGERACTYRSSDRSQGASP